MARLAAVVLAAIVLGSCARSEVVEPPDTTFAELTTLAATTTTAVAASPTTTLEARTIPSFQVVERVSGSDGDTLVVLLEEAEHDDIAVELLMYHLVDEFGPVAIHVVDVDEAVPLVLDENMDPDNPVLTEHYLARLEEGNRVVYMGPLAEYGWFLIGS